MTTTRFVILHHTWPQSEHWDVMLEQGDILLTWQLAHNPTSSPLVSMTAVRIKNHRKKYLDYEGPISGGRGEVSRVDEGGVIFLEQAEEIIIFTLEGDRLRGQFQFKHIREEKWEWSASVEHNTIG